MLKTDTRTIDGIDFRCTQLPPMRAYPLSIQLGKMLAPAIGKLKGLPSGALKAKSMEEILGTIDISALGEPLTALFDGLGGTGDNSSERFLRAMLAGVKATVDGRIKDLDTDDNINLVFAGTLPTMFKVLLFAIEVNFADFFGGRLAAVREQVAKLQAAPSAEPSA